MAKAAAAGGKKKVFRKKEKKNIPAGIAYIAASFNNTMISITDLEGNLIAQSSSGARGFRGSRKGIRSRLSRRHMKPRVRRWKRACSNAKCA